MGKQQPIEIFMPPNMLKAKLGNNDGAGIDIAAVKRAETALEKIKSEFPDWIAEDIDMLVTTCARYLETHDTEALGRLFRASHDLRGQAGTFEYPLIARIAGSLCQSIESLERDNATLQLLVEAHVGAIRAIFHNKIKSMSDRTALELTEELEHKVHAAIELAEAEKAQHQ